LYYCIRSHDTNTVRACFAAPRQICSVRRSLPQHALLTLIRTLVITQLDQCNSVFVGTSVYLQDRLQSVLNAAARLVYSRRTSEHTTPLARVFTGCASRSESSSGCVFWRTIVCMAQHRHTCPTACGRHLRSADTTTLQMLSSRRSTLGDRAFPVAAARAWNSLPPDSGLLLTFDIPKGDQVSPFSSVIRLTWHCPL